KMDPDRMVRILQDRGLERVLVNSAADWGRSDPLLTARTGEAMLAAGFTDEDVDTVLWENPVSFYGQSGRLLLDQQTDGAQNYQGNVVQRGEPQSAGR
ncbi:hydrolase TatD, partial [Georgenia sp. 10Sc9-8]|nr:hydrolase TatD [Georgenia halotolerans]